MQIGLLATGDEIIFGDTLNTNTQKMAQQLIAAGFTVGNHLTVSDDKEDMKHGLDFLAKRHTIIIITGGLGPTSDDNTRFALADYLNSQLISFEEPLTHIKNHLIRAKLPMTDGHHQQCLFPQNAALFTNPFGTAFGCYLKTDTHHFFMLPGPPRECLPMFEASVRPIILPFIEEKKTILKYLVYGLAEGDIAHKIDKALKDLAVKTGYRLDTPYVECKCYVNDRTEASAKVILDTLLIPHQLFTDNTRASNRFIDCLKTTGLTFSIEDNATGGLLETTLHKKSTHHRIFFHKRLPIHIQINGLSAFWENKTDESQTSLTLIIISPNNTTEETKILPFRSDLVIFMAVEWICYRMYHFLSLQ
jgi:nicotinamide-nucleotide amidase